MPEHGTSSESPVAEQSTAKVPKHKCPDPLRLYHSGTGRRIIVPCGGRRCSWCGPNIWRKRTLAGLHAGLRAAPPGEFLAILLTAPGDADASDFNREAAQKWRVFSILLRRAFPHARIDFWKVAELQERGHVHFHVVLRGLRWLSVAKLRRLAVGAGFGSWVGVRQPKRYPGGARSLGWYFGKYLLKHYSREAMGVTKLVTFSNGWRAGWRRLHEPAAPGTWVFAGRIGQGWDSLGHVTVGRSERKRVDRPEWHPWMGRSWQAARAAEQATMPIDF